jgi:four helix bundle protein
VPARLAVKSYRDLLVWQKAMALVVESYSVTRLLPKSESYGLIGQIQRAAVSIPANIAEGHGREHLGDYVRHLSFANGSLMELETHFLIAVELTYVTHEQTAAAMSMASEVGRMLTGLTRKLRGPLTPET